MGLPIRLGRAAAQDIVRDEAARAHRPLPGPLRISPVVLPFWSIRGESLQETIPAFSPLPLALAGFRLPAAQPSWFHAGNYPGFAVVEVPEGARLSWAEPAPGTEISIYSVPFYQLFYGDPFRPYEVFADASGSRVFWGLGPPKIDPAGSRRLVRAAASLMGIFALESFLLPGTLPAAAGVGVTAALAYPWLRGALDLKDPQ